MIITITTPIKVNEKVVANTYLFRLYFLGNIFSIFSVIGFFSLTPLNALRIGS